MSAITCKYPNCSKQVFIENGRAHDFCGRTHAQQFFSTANPTASANNAVAIKTCQLPGCTKACFVDKNTGVTHDYCGKTHRDEHKAALQAAGICTKCRVTSVSKPGKWCSSCWSLASGQSNPNQTIIKRVPRGSAQFKSLEEQFTKKWLHTTNKPTVNEILELYPPQFVCDRYNKYQNDLEKRGKFSSVMRKNKLLAPGNECRRFHGTSMECSLGINGNTTLCNSTNCRVCLIARNSFSMTAAQSNHAWSRFGRGLYFTSTSSKSNDYNGGSERVVNGKRQRVMFVAKVLVGNGQKFHDNNMTLTGPQAGYDSVIGEVGSVLNYDEVVVYKDEACKPTYMIVYEL